MPVSGISSGGKLASVDSVADSLIGMAIAMCWLDKWSDGSITLGFVCLGLSVGGVSYRDSSDHRV